MSRPKLLPAVIASFTALFTLAGCATYFTRKSCEKTNWYQHGYDVAMSGKRLDADDYVKQCQKVEAKMSYSDLDVGFKAGMSHYCQEDNVYAVGKAGKPFSYDMCDGQSLKKMKLRYDKGIAEFCQPEKAYRYGASGEIYFNVCPKTAEEAWLKEYRRGRKVFLTAKIEEKRRQMMDLDSQIGSMQLHESTLRAESMSLSGRMTTQVDQVIDPVTGAYHQRITQIPDADAERRRQEIDTAIFSLEGDISARQGERDQLSKEVEKMNLEMVTL
jgi:hypothetical protein